MMREVKLRYVPTVRIHCRAMIGGMRGGAVRCSIDDGIAQVGS